MVGLSDQDRDRIAAAVAAAELRTGGEIVCIVLRQAAHYRFPALLLASVIALTCAPVLLLATQLPALDIALGQIILMPLLYALGLWAGPRLLPRRWRNPECAQAARANFFSHGVHKTKHGTGILIFVALAERYAEVIGDETIAAAVAQEEWRGLVAALAADIRAGRLADGLIRAVEVCGGHLARVLPPPAGDINELPDRPIEG